MTCMVSGGAESVYGVICLCDPPTAQISDYFPAATTPAHLCIPVKTTDSTLEGKVGDRMTTGSNKLSIISGKAHV